MGSVTTRDFSHAIGIMGQRQGVHDMRSVLPDPQHQVDRHVLVCNLKNLVTQVSLLLFNTKLRPLSHPAESSSSQQYFLQENLWRAQLVQRVEALFEPIEASMDADANANLASTTDDVNAQVNTAPLPPQAHISILGGSSTAPPARVTPTPANATGITIEVPSEKYTESIADTNPPVPNRVALPPVGLFETSANRQKITRKFKGGENEERTSRATEPSCPIPKNMQFLGSKPVELRIGLPPRQKLLYIHRDLLTAVSPVFATMLDTTGNNGGFKEAQEGIIPFPDDRVEDWTYFLQWLCNKGGFTLGQSNPLYHPLVDDLLKEFNSYKAKREAIKKAIAAEPRAQDSTVSHTIAAAAIANTGGVMSDDSNEKQRRKEEIDRRAGPQPKPPQFGPLFRLYLLADKYHEWDGLREEIVRRVWEVAYGGTEAAPPNLFETARPVDPVYEAGRTLSAYSGTAHMPLPAPLSSIVYGAGQQGHLPLPQQAPPPQQQRRSRARRPAAPALPPLHPLVQPEDHPARTHIQYPIFVPDVNDINRLWGVMQYEKVEYNRPVCNKEGGRQGDKMPGLKDVILELIFLMKGVGDFGEDYNSEFLRDLVPRLLHRRGAPRGFMN